MTRILSTSLLALTLALVGTASMAQHTMPPCQGDRCEKPVPSRNDAPRTEHRNLDRKDAAREPRHDARSVHPQADRKKEKGVEHCKPGERNCLPPRTH
ncbi:hypothetical protein [Falsirhodobacter sp. 20TX0035]|uniref:hypothetical protein n=1 Tax=Falsirhodobacter sp. 20TX0035 TaxID=3022019 RepID=UPI0023306430|nr:hypothetical protein [Falsirhodobacter sp. 20TX0035]MDB6452045.1 hypothetical protein [Falsirhodobacter sp. 20TX0035]